MLNDFLVSSLASSRPSSSRHLGPLFLGKENLQSLTKVPVMPFLAKKAVIFYDADFRNYLDKREYKQRKVKLPLGKYAYLVDENYLFLCDHGIGGPAVVLMMESAYSVGVREFISIGFCGALNNKYEIGDLVFIERALRDEGTSYHYLAPSRDVACTKPFLNKIADKFISDAYPFQRVSSWTTDAILRETSEEISCYREEGIACVEMEAASIFAFSQYKKDVKVASMAIVSDILYKEKWETSISGAKKALKTLFQYVNASLRQDAF